MFCRHIVIGMIALLIPLKIALAQNSSVPFLERSMTISLDGISMEEALKRIAKQGGFTFSYGSTIFNESEVVTQRFTNKTVREILDQLFNGKIDYRERGKYVILIRSRKQASSRDAQVLSGYVVDEATGERLKNVSIYDPVTLSSAVTDEYGFFSIEIKNPTGEEIRLAVNKTQYADTLLVVPDKTRRLLNIPIRFDKDKIETIADSVGHKFRRMWMAVFRASEEAINMENISDTIYRKKQFSFVPFIGTNGSLSGNVINDYSFNLFGGYSLGNRKVELGGLFNAIRGDLGGVQIAGLANGVLGKKRGIQLAGLANLTGGEAKGVHVAGLSNVSFTSSEGIALAGIGNVTLGPQRGVYTGGIFNISTDDSGPAQIAGLFNFTNGRFNGVQFSGGVNLVSKDLRGAQFGGLMNLATHNVKGVQVASIFNMARDMRGVQVGLFNFSKTIKGVPLGLISVVAKGYHKLEVSADEVFYTNLAFRTGIPAFYNILTVGAKPQTFEDDQTVWSFGYGVGTAPKLSNRLFLNVDLTTSQIVGGKIEKINLLNKLYTGLDFQLTRNFSITAGVTLNGQVTDVSYNDYPELFSGYKPDIIRERNFGDDLNLKMWWGGKIGVRFF